MEVLGVCPKPQFIKEHSIDDLYLIKRIKIWFELQPCLIVYLLKLLFKFQKFKVRILIGCNEPHTGDEVVVIAAIPFTDAFLQQFKLKRMNQFLDSSLHLGIEVALPFLFEKGNDRRTQRQNLFFYMRYYLSIFIIQK